MQKMIQELLIAVDQGIQFMRKGKYHMEVRGINDFRFPLVYPDLLQNSLTVWAVPVPAGIMMDLQMSAIPAVADVVPQRSGLTVKDGMRSFFLNAGLVM